MFIWPKRRQVNRRLGRVNVLDVKLRSDQVRRSRLRWVMLAVSVMLGTGCGLYVLWRAGDWALNRLVYQNSAFAIRQIEVQTDGVVTEAQLRQWARVKPGENLLALDLVRVKRELERNPFIAAVSIERVLPNTLRLRVAEREAVAQVHIPFSPSGGGADSHVIHLDPEGFVMPPMDPRLRGLNPGASEEPLPLLTGLNLPDLPYGRRVDSAQVAAGLRLISEFARSPMVGLADLRRIDVSGPGVLVVTTGQDIEVTFGLKDLNRQLRRWRRIHDECQRKKLSLSSIDLAVPDNIPLRLREANPAPVPAPKIPKVPRSKKDHV